MKHAIIYLHGFNSASLDLSGNLLITKQKLVDIDDFCQKNNIKFCSPNVDYRNYAELISQLTLLFHELEKKGYQVLFMGSSMGGFTSDYMAMKMKCKAIMINPAISPSELLTQFTGVSENYELKQPYSWNSAHCEQYKTYEEELNQAINSNVERTVLLDMADELIDSSKTVAKYKDIAHVMTFEGGSHSFEHIVEAFPVIKNVIYNSK